MMLPAFADLNSDVIVDGLNNPWEIVFGPNGDIYFTERDGRISVSYTHLTLPTICSV